MKPGLAPRPWETLPKLCAGVPPQSREQRTQLCYPTDLCDTTDPALSIGEKLCREKEM